MVQEKLLLETTLGVKITGTKQHLLMTNIPPACSPVLIGYSGAIVREYLEYARRTTSTSECTLVEKTFVG